MKRRRPIIIGIIISLLLGVFFIIKGPRNAEVADYEYAEITTGSLVDVVTATGTLQPIEQVEVGTEISGKIDKLYADYNSVVKKGQLLATLDREVIASQNEKASAALSSTKADMELKKLQLARTQGLFNQKMVTAEELDLAETEYSRSRASYLSALAEQRSAAKNLANTEIRSPIDGIVLSRSVEQGQTVAASFSAPVLFLIARDLTAMEVNTQVDEADIGKIRVGMSVDFTVDAYPEKTFTGTVSEIRLSPTIDQKVVTYTVMITAQNPEKLLFPGMTATTTITIAKVDNATILPLSALRFLPSSPLEEGQAKNSSKRGAPTNKGATIYLDIKGFPTPMQIDTGLSDGRQVVLLTSLPANARVITASLIPEKSDKKRKVNPFMPRMGGRSGRH